MTPREKTLVRESWALVAPIADTAAELFYGRLFEMDPDLGRLFAHTDMDTQRARLMQTLAVVVKGLDDLDKLVPAVQALGRRHAGYGVRDDHYATVADALLWTLKTGLGAAYTPEVEKAWVAAYSLLAAVMQAAAADAQAVAEGAAA